MGYTEKQRGELQRQGALMGDAAHRILADIGKIEDPSGPEGQARLQALLASYSTADLLFTLNASQALRGLVPLLAQAMLAREDLPQVRAKLAAEQQTNARG